jgi:outer membrane protein assembly factor BamB
MASHRATAALARFMFLLLLASLAVPAGKWAAAPPTRVGSPELPQRLHLSWTWELPPLKPAWPDQPLLQFDAAYQPVVHNRTMYLASSRTDSVTAYDLATGEERWCFRADGPVRFAPVGWSNRLFFVCDDGCLYCVDAAAGTLLWRFRGGPDGRLVLGNERLISAWPARGAPAIADGVVYFAAGIWPFMGIFLHALDARTGRVVWTNDGDGSIYIKQPHQADAFGGIAPQGRLVVAGDRLLVPGGRSVPACYDRHTGKLLHFRLADNSKRGGGPDVEVQGELFFNGSAAFDLATGDHLGPVGAPLVLAGDTAYTWARGECRAVDLGGARAVVRSEAARKQAKSPRPAWRLQVLAGVDVPRRVEALARAGSRLFAGSQGEVYALQLPLRSGPLAYAWHARVDGRPTHLLAAEGRLLVTTQEGRIYCFGPGRAEPIRHKIARPTPTPADEWTDRARAILQTAAIRDGYCMVQNPRHPRLLTEIVRQSDLRVMAVEPDGDRARELREELVRTGLHGERAAVVSGDLPEMRLPPYLASLLILETYPEEEDQQRNLLRAAFAVLRPYGGKALLPLAEDRAPAVEHVVTELGLEGARVRAAGGRVLLERTGPLPGAGIWTHEHADAANTRVSRDERVKAPLGLLWFGGPSHTGILSRHGHGPQPQVIDGRAILEGPDLLRAIDIYTGRLLWETRLPALGKAFENPRHQPGANASGSNYVSAADGIYVAHGTKCLRLDPATGRQTAAFSFPAFPGGSRPATWSYLNVAGDFIVGGVAFPVPKDARKKLTSSSSSKSLAVLDRRTGRVLWSTTARSGFRNNAICIGGGRLYAIDRLSFDLVVGSKRPGPEPITEPARLIAFDLATGKEAWSSTAEVFGTWLSYSAERDVVVEAGRVARDTLLDEPRGMRAWDAARGRPLWRNATYAGPAMLRGDQVLMDGRACDLRTGAPILRTDPLTGALVPWSWTRTYGCNTPMASQNLLTFRSGAAGYFDLCNDGGTGNIGGFRSGCTNNLVVAGGVVCAPDYTRTCTCSYQNQTSLALVPVPDAEMWTYYGRREVTGVVRQVGINLGAPGNRKADDGTLWLEYPPVGGPSPRLTVRTVPTRPDWFRRHSSQVEGGLGWVGASGARGLRELILKLASDAATDRPYSVRLHFAEPDGLGPAGRVFHVALQGRQVLSHFDISKEAGGPGRVVVKEFRGITVSDELRIALWPAEDDHTGTTVLCGIEVHADGW